jgi:hypothetical protein
MVISLGVKQPGREVDHSPPSSAEIKNSEIIYYRDQATTVSFWVLSNSPYVSLFTAEHIASRHNVEKEGKYILITGRGGP